MGRLALIAAIVLVLLASASGVSASPPGRAIRVGLLYSVGTFDPVANRFERELIDGLRDLGYTLGRDVTFEFRSGAAGPASLIRGAQELVAAKLDMIVVRGTQPTLEVSKLTKTIPIVMVGTADPVETGLVASLARPGGNVTGLAINAAELAAKRVQLLQEAVPNLTRVAVLWNASIRSMSLGFQNIEHAAPKLGVTLQSVRLASSDEFAQAFEALERSQPGGLIVLFGPLRGDDLPRIVEFVVRHRIPTVFEGGQGVRGGGLMEFGPAPWRMARRAARYIDRIANGARPGDLPVEEPTEFELTINMKAAKAMGLTLSPSLLIRADRVVE